MADIGFDEAGMKVARRIMPIVDRELAPAEHAILITVCPGSSSDTAIAVGCGSTLSLRHAAMVMRQTADVIDRMAAERGGEDRE